MRYLKPYYLPSYQTLTPLYSDFKDNSVEFYSVKYWIDHSRFVSRLAGYPAMQNLFDGNGRLIFRNCPYDRSKYRLLDETKEDKGCYFEVTETYGYTPEITFSRPTTVAWQKPGMYDTATGNVTRTMALLSTDSATQRHTVTVDNSDGAFVAGNTVYLNKAYYTIGSQWWYRQKGNSVSILAATATTIVVPFFTWQTIYEDGSLGGTYASDDSTHGGFNGPGDKTAVQSATVRAPLASDFAAIVSTEFATVNSAAELGDLQPAWTVTSGGQPVDTLSDATSPTLAEYNALVGTSSVLLAAPQAFELLLGNVYKKTSTYVRYQ